MIKSHKQSPTIPPLTNMEKKLLCGVSKIRLSFT